MFLQFCFLILCSQRAAQSAAPLCLPHSSFSYAENFYAIYELSLWYQTLYQKFLAHSNTFSLVSPLIL